MSSSTTSWRAGGQQNPWRNAFPTNAPDPMWEPHMPLSMSANSSFPSSQQMHFNFTLLGLLPYRVSSTNWYILALWDTLSASSWSSGSSPVGRKWTMCLAQVGARGSATRTSGTSSTTGAHSSSAGTMVPTEGCGLASCEFPVTAWILPSLFLPDLPSLSFRTWFSSWFLP